MLRISRGLLGRILQSHLRGTGDLMDLTALARATVFISSQSKAGLAQAEVEMDKLEQAGQLVNSLVIRNSYCIESQ
jgi:hypothetical protein